MKIKDCITEYLINEYKLNGEEEADFSYVSANDLVTSERIDLVTKINYLKAIDEEFRTDYFYDQYRATIEAFTDGNFTEHGNPEKNSFKKYADSFKELFYNIRKDGFREKISAIPVAKNKAILDGAHRVAISAYLGLKVPTITINDATCSYNYEFFRKKALDKKHLDNMILEYAKIKNNIYVICLWPICNQAQQDTMTEIIKNNFKVVYEKDIQLNYNGLKNFMSQVYYEQKWIGTLENGYKGIGAKLDKCYKEENPTKIIVVESDDTEKITKVKAEIREKIGIGNHSIHSTDDKQETIKMLELLLNDNNVEFLNKANPYRYIKATKDLSSLKKLLLEKGVNLEDVAVDSGTVLALYGLRPSDDLDIIASPQIVDKLRKSADIHNDEAEKYYETTIDNLLYNPKNYFYYEGVKIISPRTLINMKKKRGDKKDDEDYYRLLLLLGKKQDKLLNFKSAVRRRANHFKNRAIYVIVPILQKMGIYKFLKKIIFRGKK